MHFRIKINNILLLKLKKKLRFSQKKFSVKCKFSYKYKCMRNTLKEIDLSLKYLLNILVYLLYSIFVLKYVFKFCII